jgi:holin-like protein
MLARNFSLALGLLICAALWAAGSWVAEVFALPIPGGVVGMAALFALIAARIIRPEWVEAGTDLLIRHLQLFFIPAVMGVLSYPLLFGPLGLKILISLIIGAFVVMASVGLAVQYMMRGPQSQEAEV